MSTVVWIGFCQGLFAAILMFTKKESSIPDKILSGWLTLLAFEFLTCGLDYEIFGKPLLSSSFILFNPALYLYICSLTRPSFQLKWSQLLHLSPFVFFETYAYVIKAPLSLDTFFQLDQHFLFRMSFGIATIISWCVYNPMSLVLVHKHRMNLRNERSNIEKNENLGWVLGVSIFYVVYCIFAFMLSIVVYFESLNPLTPYFYNYSVLLFLIFVLSFYGLRQQVVPIQLLIDEPPAPYKNSTLSAEMKQKIRQKIIFYFENEKAYLNPELNMNLLSEHLKIPKYQITEVMNVEIGMNFFQFVNQYRINAVKKKLENKKNIFSIEAIGYDCGFSSKSSFYTVFKNVTGETPVSYRNKIIS